MEMSAQATRTRDLFTSVLIAIVGPMVVVASMSTLDF